LDIDGGGLARALEVEIGLPVRLEVPGQRHRLRHGSERGNPGPVRDVRRRTAARDEVSTDAGRDDHHHNANDEGLAEQASSHAEILPTLVPTANISLIVVHAIFRKSDRRSPR
jgi:hypothetical protein